MADKIALKRLTKSDLTIFEWHFKNKNAGNQKSINLNADVFVDQIYPDIKGKVPTAGVPVSVVLYGPGLTGAIKTESTITPQNKQTNQKNWRLGGPLIQAPDKQPSKFQALEAGDLILLKMSGEPVPNSIEAILISRADSDDLNIHAALDELIPGGKRTMVAASVDDLSYATSGITIAHSHPFSQLLIQDFEKEIEEASYGNVAGSRRVARRATRRVTASDLMLARTAAERIGRDGEILVNSYLSEKLDAGSISSFKWEADLNAAAPFDFILIGKDGEVTKVDAKSTTGPFDRSFHISASEIAEAANTAEPYKIFRVYEISEEGAKLRASEDITDFARDVSASLSALPQGVQPDSFRVEVGCLGWGEVHEIFRLDDD